MQTSEVLYAAADLIETRGWTQGCKGWPGWGEGSALCLEGAFMAAMGTNDPIEVDDCPASRAVREHLECEWRYLFMWNDDIDRTQAEVVAVLRACAVIEAAREEAGVRA